jgi:hypothetical protein
VAFIPDHCQERLSKATSERTRQKNTTLPLLLTPSGTSALPMWAPLRPTHTSAMQEVDLFWFLGGTGI